jgi:hypothetical protein
MKTTNWKSVIGICLVIVSWLLVISMAWAVPQYMNYQGVLRDSAGNLVTGTKAMTFKIYDDATSTTNKLFEMTSSEVKVSNGLYNVQIGPLGGVDLASGRRWIEAAVGTDTLSPRLEILAVAYALLAASAESASKVGGYSVATSGNSIIPTTDATTGKLNALVIPAAGVNVASAEYATLAGTANTAGNANYATLSGTASSAASVKGQVTAEAASGLLALFVKGKIGITGEAWGVGYFTSGGDPSTTVTDTRLTPSSIVFGSVPGTDTYNPGKTYVYRKGTNQIVCDVTTVVPSENYPFYYVIIN